MTTIQKQGPRSVATAPEPMNSVQFPTLLYRVGRFWSTFKMCRPLFACLQSKAGDFTARTLPYGDFRALDWHGAA